MRIILFIVFAIVIGYVLGGTTTAAVNTFKSWVIPTSTHVGCLGFTPYVHGYSSGASIPIATIRTLMTNIATQTKFKCLMFYSLNSAWTAVAQSLGLKVVGIVWLTNVRSQNTVQINNAISAIRSYPSTVIALSCGSELGYRYGMTTSIANEVLNCVNVLRNTKTTIPIGSNDALPVWNKKWYTVSNHLDWVGVNIYPWYDNPGGCTHASQGAYQTYIRYVHTKALYNKLLVCFIQNNF
jgi:exo-beta-1,3-glucanase (GH17 family)